MRIGAMDNVLVKPWSELFDEAARLGFDGVELDLKAETYRDSEVWSERGRRALVDRSRRAGVEIASVCMASVAGLITKPETHDQGIEALADLRRFCDELGAGVILFPMIKQAERLLRAEQSEEDAVELWRDGFTRAFAQSDGARAKVGMESVGRVGRSADQALAMIEAVGSPQLGVYYDVGNAYYQGFDGIAEMKRWDRSQRLGSHIVQIHVKEIGAEMGEGKLDFPAIFSTIREIGYDGYLMLETEAGDDPAANALRNLEFVRSLL